MTLSPSKSPSRCQSARGRRGALLLLVLGMLTLFLMIGTLMLVLALRARSTARAFADAVAGSGNRAAAARALLDEALMRLLRGSPPATTPIAGGAAPPQRESLLADRYGTTTLTGKLTSITPNGALLNAEITIPPGFNTNTLELVGRILTIKPQASDSAPVTSFRIVEANGNKLNLANLRTVGLRPLPAAAGLPCDIFVNGREFAGPMDNEPWDAFDPANLFFTQASPQGSGATIARPAYSNAVCEVDNDGDGVLDGVWLNDALPGQADGSKARVSYLVLDLGGRLNLNAHGSLAGAAGSGPAAVDGSTLFADPTVWPQVLAGSSSPLLPAQLKPGVRRGPPALGGTVQGRFGAGPTNTYSLRLDFDGPRPLSRASAFGNVYTCGELEWILRIYDKDTHTLPPRLATLLNDSGEAARMLVTTDGWDTCGMVGAAARKFESDAKTGNLNPAELPPETKEALRLNIDQLLQDDPAGDGDDVIRQQFFRDLVAACVAAGAPAGTKTQQWAANVVDFVDTDADAGEYSCSPADGAKVTGVEPPGNGGFGDWNKGRLESIGELLGVPSLNQVGLEDALSKNEPVKSLAVEYPEILDALTIASPFRTTIFAALPGRTLCRWREPGRINVNTCEDKLWDALTGVNIANPFAVAGAPATSTADLLLRVPEVFSGSVDRDVRKLDRRLANRLANIATTRSDVFAVWITLELTTPDADDEPSYHRLFAIVDRSIPVGYALGQNLNVRDTIRVSRHLE
jgi:hypothetical protein